ncbi:hypothetical protein A5881_001844 [Enterococcus termitis]|nr:hypothetical protein A5881_001835 [Enterococcus termitis]
MDYIILVGIIVVGVGLLSLFLKQKRVVTWGNVSCQDLKDMINYSTLKFHQILLTTVFERLSPVHQHDSKRYLKTLKTS